MAFPWEQFSSDCPAIILCNGFKNHIFEIAATSLRVQWVIGTHHDWPSQMHEHLLISRVKTRAIASVFDAANQQIWVHLWGPCVMGLYYIMIIIKILKKRILINRISDNRRCQIILWWQLKAPLSRAWFGCFPGGYTPSDDYMEFPRAIQMTSRAALKGVSQAAVLWKPARQHTTQNTAAFVPPSARR